MLIVNGQLMHEGDRITPDTTLEEIRPKSVVLRHKQWRYEMPV
jgi:general secretion pathway protein B